MRLNNLRVLISRALMSLPLVASAAVGASPTVAAPVAAAPASCQFTSPNGGPSPIQRVIHIQFDNVHFRRDIPSVPSDLEQMPHLLNFITGQGVLLANNHTALISHTAYGLVTGLTGVYGDQSGIPVSNSFEVYNASSVGAYNTSAFTYWTNPVAPDPANAARTLPFQMIDASGHNLQAPWVPYVRAGCNFGAVSTVNMVLENNGNDVNQVFGVGSPEASESPADRTNDFVGIAVHCADSTCSTVGSGAPALGSHAKAELGGQGVAALYGHKYVSSQVSPITTIDGTTTITGFNQANTFNPTPNYTLGYLFSLLQAGVPVVYGYVADAHDSRVSCAPTSATNPVVQDTNNGVPCGAFAPGEPGYVDQLRAWDSAFGNFFTRLDAIGINTSNTLFVIHADENDHYAGSAPLNPGCDGIAVPCHYDRTVMGEVTSDLPLLLRQQGLYDFGMIGGTGATPGTPRAGFTNTDLPYALDFDTAPGFWLKGHPPTASTSVRTLEKALTTVTAPNPYLGQTQRVFKFFVDTPGLKALHMITSDNDRTPGLVAFGAPDRFVQTNTLINASNTSTCNRFPSTTDATCLSNAFNWLHGNFEPDIVNTWAAIVGPGVRNAGVDAQTWTDHADLRPTVMSLLCLQDNYMHAGRVLLEDVQDTALPASVSAQRDALGPLVRTFKRLNAPVGQFGRAAIQMSTTAIRGDDAKYADFESKVDRLTAKRDALVVQMQAQLQRIPGCGGFSGPPAETTATLNQLTAQGRALLALVQGARGTENPDDEGFTDN